jgi:hypothetical protein
VSRRRLRPRAPAAARCLVVAIIALVIGPGGLARGQSVPLYPLSCIVPGQVTTDVHGWRHSRPPAFTHGVTTLTDLAINVAQRGEADPLAPAYGVPSDGQVDATVTNGTTVAETRDSGCHWNEVYSLTEVPGALDSTIAGIRVGTASVTRFTYVFGAQKLAGSVTRPFVAVGSANCPSRTWCASTTGFQDSSASLALAGVPVDLAVSSLNAECAWLLTQPPASVSPGRSLYRSVDHGTTWTQVAVGTTVERLVEDPYGGAEHASGTAAPCQEVWGTSATEVFRSTDGGGAFTRVFSSPAGVASAQIRQYWKIGVSNGNTGQMVDRTEIDVFTKDSRWHKLASDGRPLTRGVGTPGSAESGVVPAAFSDTDVVIFTSNGVFRYSAGRGWRDVSPSGRPIVRAQADMQGMWDQGCTGGCERRYAYTVVGFTPTEMVFEGTPLRIRSGDTVPVQIGPPPSVPGMGGVNGSLSPASTVLALPPGRPATVGFDFHVPWHPAAVDVDFNVDTTFSMDPAINGLIVGTAAMTSQFAAAGIDARFGVASVKDLEFTSPKPYQRLLKVVAPGPQFGAALQGLKPTVGGGADRAEAQTFGVVQALTGRGFQGDRDGYPVVVPAGQDAGFRPDATKVIVLITDAPSNEGGAYPTISRTIQELRARNVLFVGIYLKGRNQVGQMVDQMERLAAASGARAPSGGVDCDGDGVRDVPPGAPLVCGVAAGSAGTIASIGPAVANMVLAARPHIPAGLAVTGDTRVLRRVVGGTSAVFSAEHPSVMKMAATFECASADAGRTFRLSVAARVFRADIAASSVVVTCLTPHQKVPLVPAGPIAPGTSVATGAVPNVPNPPVPDGPPAQAVNTNVNPQPGTNTANGVAGQNEDSPQLAMATNEGGETSTSELLFMAATVLMTAAAGWHRLRAETPVARATD